VLRAVQRALAVALHFVAGMKSIATVLLFAAACVADVGDTGGMPGGDPSNPNDPSDPGKPDDPSDPPPGGGISVADFMTALGHKECDDAFTCKANFPTDAGVTFAEAFGASAMACYTDAATYYDAAAIQASISAGKIAYDGNAAKTCTQGFAAPTCGTYWTNGPDYPAACDTALVGKVATGAACTNDFECSADNWCDETNKCAAIPANARRSRSY
jgi:hypothetical protein